jgi:hypothetical protein
MMHVSTSRRMKAPERVGVGELLAPVGGVDVRLDSSPCES